MREVKRKGVVRQSFKYFQYTIYWDYFYVISYIQCTIFTLYLSWGIAMETSTPVFRPYDLKDAREGWRTTWSEDTDIMFCII